MPNIPPPPMRLTSGPCPFSYSNNCLRDKHRQSRPSEARTEEAPEPGSPALGATIPRLAQSATTIYHSVSAAIQADEAAPLTGRSDVESRDGESPCRDNTPPGTPTIYKKDDEEDDDCGVVRPPPVPPLSSTSNLASTLGSPQFSNQQSTHVVTWGINDSDHANVGTRLIAPASDMDKATTPEVAQILTPRLLKRCGSAASANASLRSAHCTRRRRTTVNGKSKCSLRSPRRHSTMSLRQTTLTQQPCSRCKDC